MHVLQIAGNLTAAPELQTKDDQPYVRIRVDADLESYDLIVYGKTAERLCRLEEGDAIGFAAFSDKIEGDQAEGFTEFAPGRRTRAFLGL